MVHPWLVHAQKGARFVRILAFAAPVAATAGKVSAAALHERQEFASCRKVGVQANAPSTKELLLVPMSIVWNADEQASVKGPHLSAK
eukprot:5758161-Pleurochrysis_carterae.AAC.2